MNGLLMIAVLAPTSFIGYGLQIAATVFIILKTSMQSDFRIKSKKLVLFFVGGVFLSTSLLTGLITRSIFDMSSLLVIINVFLMLLVFPFKLSFRLSEYTLVFLLFFIFGSQIVMALKIEPLDSLLNSVYIRQELNVRSFQENLGFSQLSWVRFGGIFGNPNQCAKAVTFIFVMFYFIDVRNRALFILVVGIVFASLILTGSRTGLGIFFLMVVFGSLANVKKFNFIIFYFFPIILAILMFSLYFGELRFFDLDSLVVSITEKYKVIWRYIDFIQGSYPIELFFGSGQISRVEYDFPDLRLRYFDSELGYILQAFGFFGVIVLAAFYFSNVKKLTSGYRFFGFTLLWLMSSTILVNAKFSFLYLLCYSFIYSMQKERKGKTKTNYRCEIQEPLRKN